MSTDKNQIAAVHQRDLYLYFYEDFLKPERTQRECSYIINHCVLNRGEAILDLACGHGRHSIQLTKEGMKVCGWDINRAFLELARQTARAENLDIDFIENDILNINYNQQFHAGILLYNALGFFNRGEAKKLLLKIHDALVPGGKLFLDIKNRDHILKEIQPCSITEKNRDLMIDQLSFDSTTGTTTNRRIYIKDGQRHDATFTMYLYHYQDILQMLQSMSFKVNQVLGHWNGSAFTSDSRRMIFVLEREK